MSGTVLDAALVSSGLTTAAPREPLRLEKHVEAMGASFSVVLYGDDEGELGAAAEAAFDEVHRLDRMLSNYQPDSEWSRVNRHAALRPVAVSAELYALDPGGIGKGYAVDRMIDVLRRRHVETALVSAAGSSVYGLGAPPDEPRGWPITIRAPGDPLAPAADVRLKNMSIGTGDCGASAC